MQAVDDGGEEQAEGVETAEDSEVCESAEPDLHIEDSAFDFGPVEAFVFGAVLVETVTCALFLGWREKACGFDGIG